MGENEEMLILGEACIKESVWVCMCACGTCVLSGQRNG